MYIMGGRQQNITGMFLNDLWNLYLFQLTLNAASEN